MSKQEIDVDGIQRFLDSCSDHCVPSEGVTFEWSKPGVGFGLADFYFSAHEEGGEIKLYCDNETMSKEFIKERLCKMVDDAIFVDDK